MKIPISRVAGWMLFILDISSADASDPAFFFVFGPPLCGVGGVGGDYGSFILVPLKKTWGILDSGIAVHSYTSIQMWMSWTMGLRSIAQTKRQCKSEAREATKKREGPCSTSVLNSESFCAQPTTPLHCNVIPSSLQLTAWLTPPLFRPLPKS